MARMIEILWGLGSHRPTVFVFNGGIETLQWVATMCFLLTLWTISSSYSDSLTVIMPVYGLLHQWLGSLGAFHDPSNTPNRLLERKGTKVWQLIWLPEFFSATWVTNIPARWAYEISSPQGDYFHLTAFVEVQTWIFFPEFDVHCLQALTCR